MKERTHRTITWIAGCSVLAASLAATGCEQAPNAHAESPAPDAVAVANQPLTRVAVVRPQSKTLRRVSDQPGQVEPHETTPLVAKVAGYVETINVDIGDRVKQGDLLARLYVPELAEELKQKAAHVELAKAGVLQAEAAQRVAEARLKAQQARLAEARAAVDRYAAERRRWQSEYDRVAELARQSAVTQKLETETLSQLDAAKAAQVEAEARITSAEAGVAHAESEVASAVADVAAAKARVVAAETDEARVAALLRYSEVRAPYDGRVTARYVHTGHFMRDGDQQPLFTVADASTVRVFVDVPEMDAAHVTTGDPAVVRVQSLGGELFEGTVTRHAGVLDPRSRTLRTEIDLPNDQGHLLAGMYVTVSIVVAQRDNVLTLPTSALFVEEGQTFCHAVEGGRVIRRAVNVGLTAAGEAEIVDGLSADVAIIPRNPRDYAPGLAVEAVGSAL